MDEGAPAERPGARCRLYLVSPSGLADPATEGGHPLTAFAAGLAAALEAGDVACVLLLTSRMVGKTLVAAVEALCPLVQARDVAFLLEDRFEVAAETGCDGVHLTDPAAYDTARRRLGGQAIVGVGCTGSRHEAMVAADRGADYVAFGRLEAEPLAAEPELVAWWQQLMTVPCVALGGTTPERCRELARAGADFVAVGSVIWDDPGGPGAAVRACNQAIARDPR